MDSYDLFHSFRVSIDVDLEKGKIYKNWGLHEPDELVDWIRSWLEDQLQAMVNTNDGLVNFHINGVEDIE